MPRKSTGAGNPQSRHRPTAHPHVANPRQNVYHIEPGHEVSGKDGRLRIVDPKTGEVVEDLGEMPTRPSQPGESDTEEEPPGIPDQGWIVYSTWQNSGTEPIASFTTTWVVPPPPQSDDGQYFYLFNGLMDLGNQWILQPVLQWGSTPDGGGNYWGIANWYVPQPSLGVPAVKSSLIQVQPGDVLQGVMTLTGQSAGQYSYQSSFVGYPSIDLPVNNVAQLITASETLEAYSMTQCSDYPNTPFTAFYDIDIKAGQSQSTSTDVTPAWNPNVAYSDCGQNCVIVSDDSPGGAVYLYYHGLEQSLYFVNDKSSFGRDEVSDVIKSNGGLFPAAFFLALDGFTLEQLTIDQPSLIVPSLAGPFDNLVTVAPSTQYQPSYDPSTPHTAQRIIYPYDVKFDQSAVGQFPSNGTQAEELTADITIGSTALGSQQKLTAATIFTLVAGSDPYFTNIDPKQNNQYYLSQDLRVFTVAPAAQDTTPIDNVKFHFGTGSPLTFDSAAAYNYIWALVNHFNANYADPAGTDPFDLNHSVLPGQNDVYSGDSTVTPNSLGPGGIFDIVNNYNFALARVRLMDPSGTQAPNVRVFFRLMTTQTFDTDYVNTASQVSAGNPNITYPSLPTGSPNDPTSPLPGTAASGVINGCSLPYFAASDKSDLGPGGVNNQTIIIPAGKDQTWAYFGCFLNVYDSTNTFGGYDSQHWLGGSTHCCLVAQIAYSGVPIQNTLVDGVIESPENCVQLAQRNLQITPSGNPGYPLSHLIPQTFDTRPSPPPSAPGIGSYPDELMIDWRNTPIGSIASVYWPQASSADVLALAAKLYPSSSLVATDAHTVQCTVGRGMTYVPVPGNASESLAGLITVQLPTSIRVGNQFEIVVRRITSRRVDERPVQVAAGGRSRAAVDQTILWRYVVGTFQMSVPVRPDDAILPGEENQLAILKWRFQQLPPQDRWYPVLERYVAVLSQRITGLGGDPAQIDPSPVGYWPHPKGQPPARRVHEHTGKITALRYDRFGDFEGFDLVTLTAEKHRFRAHEHRIEELVRHAWFDRMLVSVVVTTEDPTWPAEIVLRRG
jgi:hypothetical protein